MGRWQHRNRFGSDAGRGALERSRLAAGQASFGAGRNDPGAAGILVAKCLGIGDDTSKGTSFALRWNGESWKVIHKWTKRRMLIGDAAVLSSSDVWIFSATRDAIARYDGKGWVATSVLSGAGFLSVRAFTEQNMWVLAQVPASAGGPASSEAIQGGYADGRYQWNIGPFLVDPPELTTLYAQSACLDPAGRGRDVDREQRRAAAVSACRAVHRRHLDRGLPGGRPRQRLHLVAGRVGRRGRPLGNDNLIRRRAPADRALRFGRVQRRDPARHGSRPHRCVRDRGHTRNREGMGRRDACRNRRQEIQGSDHRVRQLTRSRRGRGSATTIMFAVAQAVPGGCRGS